MDKSLGDEYGKTRSRTTMATRTIVSGVSVEPELDEIMTLYKWFGGGKDKHIEGRVLAALGSQSTCNFSRAGITIQEMLINSLDCQ